MQVSGQLNERVHQFANEHNLDQRCIDDLLGQPNWIVERIIDDTVINPGCNNPSAVITCRIGQVKKEGRDRGNNNSFGGRNQNNQQNNILSSPNQQGQQGVSYNSQTQCYIDNEATLNAYAEENRLDSRAIDTIRNAPAEVRKHVIMQGPLAGNIRSTSAVIFSRVQKALHDYQNRGLPNSRYEQGASYNREQQSRGNQDQQSRGTQNNFSNSNRTQHDQRSHGPKVTPGDVHSFCDRAMVDERARTALLEAPPMVQAGVLQDGQIVDTDNPSAVLISRIGKHRKLRSNDQPMGGGNYGGNRGHVPFGQMPNSNFRADSDRNRSRSPRHRENHSPDYTAHVDPNYHGSRGETEDPDLREQIFEFCRLNMLSNGVQERLLKSDDGSIESIMSLGEFPPGCTDPSQVIMERLDNLPTFYPKFHSFLRDNGVDEQAQGVFLSQTLGVMDRVLQGGPLEGRNVSAVLMSRIKQAKQ